METAGCKAVDVSNDEHLSPKLVHGVSNQWQANISASGLRWAGSQYTMPIKSHLGTGSSDAPFASASLPKRSWFLQRGLCLDIDTRSPIDETLPLATVIGWPQRGQFHACPTGRHPGLPGTHTMEIVMRPSSLPALFLCTANQMRRSTKSKGDRQDRPLIAHACRPLAGHGFRRCRSSETSTIVQAQLSPRTRADVGGAGTGPGSWSGLQQPNGSASACVDSNAKY
jgi:hypothetical protein